jgi:iron complex outermembrane receptor protein
MIDYALYTGDVFVAANIGNVDVTGMEAGMRWRVKDDVAWSPITYMRLSMNWQSVTNTAPVATRYVADVLRFQGIAEIRASIPHSPVLFNDITFMVRVLDRMGNLEERLLGTKAVRVVGDATLTMSAFAPALISFEVTNIWNTPYVEAGWVQMPGRWVRMRVGTTL